MVMAFINTILFSSKGFRVVFHQKKLIKPIRSAVLNLCDVTDDVMT